MYSKITLGLLFPNRADLRKCDCEEQLDFCECYKAEPRRVKWEKSYLSPSHKKEYLNEYLIELHIREDIKPEDLKSILIDKQFPLQLRLTEKKHHN